MILSKYPSHVPEGSWVVVGIVSSGIIVTITVVVSSELSVVVGVVSKETKVKSAHHVRVVLAWKFLGKHFWRSCLKTNFFLVNSIWCSIIFMTYTDEYQYYDYKQTNAKKT